MNRKPYIATAALSFFAMGMSLVAPGGASAETSKAVVDFHASLNQYGLAFVKNGMDEEVFTRNVVELVKGTTAQSLDSQDANGRTAWMTLATLVGKEGQGTRKYLSTESFMKISNAFDAMGANVNLEDNNGKSVPEILKDKVFALYAGFKKGDTFTRDVAEMLLPGPDYYKNTGKDNDVVYTPPEGYDKWGCGLIAEVNKTFINYGSSKNGFAFRFSPDVCQGFKKTSDGR